MAMAEEAVAAEVIHILHLEDIELEAGEDPSKDAKRPKSTEIKNS